MARAKDATAPTEQDIRLGMLNTLMTTPHRKLDGVWPVHQEMIEQDPLFYVRLAAWYDGSGEVRDHKECFAASLALSNFDGHRDVGLALLREMPPYQVARVVNFISGTKEVKTVKEPGPKTTLGKRPRKAIKGAGGVAGATGTAVIGEPAAPPKKELVEFGLFKVLPQSIKTEVARYLREREADDRWFDATVLRARADVKRLYALCHVKPSARAQKVLFDNCPPPDSSLFALRELAKAATPAEQAKVIVEHKIPFTVAQAVVAAMTPTVLAALIEVMSPQELVNSLGMLKKRGALDSPDLKKLVEEKLELAKKGKRVHALKGAKAAEAAGLTGDIAKAVEEIGDAQVKARGRIKRATAILVDKSASQHVSVEVGKQIAAMVSAVAEADLFVYAFDTMPYPVAVPKDKSLAGWAKSFAGIKAHGGTSYGCSLKAMEKAGQSVEQFVLVGDGGDNSAHMFHQVYPEYCARFGVKPNVVLVHIPGDGDVLTGNCKGAGIEVDKWQFTGDYMSLPQLIPFLTKGSKLDLLIEIMATPLPQRRAS